MSEEQQTTDQPEEERVQKAQDQQSEQQDSDQQIDPKLIEQVRQQVLQQIHQEQETERQKRLREREAERESHKEYVEKMKKSKDPWVEVVGMAETEQGVKVELEWNDAFVEYLRNNGVAGTDDEQVIQRWVTLLLRDMADQMEGNQESSYE